MKNFISLTLLLLSFNICNSQDTLSKSDIYHISGDFSRVLGIRKFNKIYHSKIDQCDFIDIEWAGKTLDSFYYNGRKINLSQCEMLDVTIVYGLKKEKAYIITNKNKIQKFEKNRIYDILVKYDKFYIWETPIPIEEYPSSYREKGYYPYLFNYFTYPTLWNKIMYKVGLIKEFTYLERLKCIDFDKMKKKLDNK